MPTITVVPKPDETNYFLLQNSDFLLLQNSDKLILAERLADQWTVVPKAS